MQRKMDGLGEDKNFYIKENKAYTEDDVLVRSVFVYKIPRKVTQEEMYRYFSAFGEVKKVNLVADKKRSRRRAPKVGSVHFADAVVAAKVLQKAHHTLQMKRIFVKACDSWHQCMAEENYDTTNASCVQEHLECSGQGDAGSTCKMQTEKPTLLKLNDDCLEHIIKKLELRDQVRFARTCQRFRSVFQMSCKLEHKALVLDRLEGMTLWEIREFFKLTGANIETLIGSIPYKDRERIMEFIGHDCPHVKSINLDSCKIKSAALRRLLEQLNEVVELQLHDCALKDNAVLAIKKLPRLQILHLTENYELTGKYLDKLKSLKELNLYGCGNIQSTFIVQMLQSLKELRLLNIQRCERMSSLVFTEMTEHCAKLETLKISCPDSYCECVAQLPRLKHLEIAVISPLVFVRQQLFVELALHKANQLEYLKVVAKNCITYERAVQIGQLKQLKTLICPNNEQLNDDCLRKFSELENLEELVIKNCPEITNEGLLHLLRKCTKLRRINLQFCNNINDAFVFKAIAILKSIFQNDQQGQKEPLVLFVTKTGINEFVLNNAQYVEANSLLKLSFHVPLSMGLEEDDLLDMLEFLDEEDDDDLEDDVDFLGEMDGDEDFFGYDMYDDYSDSDEELHNAYNLFGGYGAYVADLNDYIW